MNKDIIYAENSFLSITSEQIKSLPNATNIGEDNLLTAPKIAIAYNIPPSNGAGVKIGIISLGGGFSQSDIDKSLSNLGLTAPNIGFVGVDGAINDYTGNIELDGENTLDIVCVAGMVPSANVVVYKGTGSFNWWSLDPNRAQILNSNTSFGNAIQKAVDDDCDVITISWGNSEKKLLNKKLYYSGDFLTAPLANAAAKNIAVFVASGDYGSSPIGNTSAIGNITAVDYPSGNPNVTSVGGSYLTLNNSGTRANETVYNQSENIPGFGGSGGVSSMINLPGYQANLSYQTYPENFVYSLVSRGVPDVAAAMNAYGVWMGNTVWALSGTSASAPIMAGMLARFISLNNGRRPPNGSSGLNSIFYKNTNSFYDIFNGNNASKLPIGYSATTGWDAATGLGPQSNAVQTYQSVTSAGTKIKGLDGNWKNIASVSIKTAEDTWTSVRKIWIKTSANTWKQTY